MTSIEWTDCVWNCVRGCARVSPGCQNCYAERQAHRFSGPGQPYEGLTVLSGGSPRWTGEARFVRGMLTQPFRWKKPRRVFVNSMSDLFHDDLTNEQIAAVFGVMAATGRHTYQVLTKRPERMLDWFRWVAQLEGDPWTECHWAALCLDDDAETIHCKSEAWEGADFSTDALGPWPLPNVHLGVSVEDQKRADERVPLLLKTPAALRFLSCEPLLGPVDLDVSRTPDDYMLGPVLGGVGGIDWVIVGGESGPGARPCSIDLVRDIVGQCAKADVACFVKQLGSTPLKHIDCAGCTSDGALCAGHERGVRFKHSKGGDPSEWAEDLRVREFPRERTSVV